ncbi:uncharacterized protein LOC143066494 [Mytilus galloprovincialis]|uniref:uncharacterized protein LOC143066494 n=1 Tax=Mytilus galloprovincialis TaxID=29158 RepID=UPI003F7C1FAD
MMSLIVVAALLACTSATFYKGNFGPQSGYQRFEGYGPMNSNFGMMRYGNQYDMFKGGYLNNDGVGGFQNRGLNSGYKKGGTGGYFKDGNVGYQKGGMRGQFNGGNIGYQKGGMGGQINGGTGGYMKDMMDSGLYPSGFEGWNSFGSGLGMQGLGGYPKFGNNGFGKMGGFLGTNGLKKGGY